MRVLHKNCVFPKKLAIRVRSENCKFANNKSVYQQEKYLTLELLVQTQEKLPDKVLTFSISSCRSYGTQITFLHLTFDPPVLHRARLLLLYRSHTLVP